MSKFFQFELIVQFGEDIDKNGIDDCTYYTIIQDCDRYVLIIKPGALPEEVDPTNVQNWRDYTIDKVFETQRDVFRYFRTQLRLRAGIVIFTDSHKKAELVIPLELFEDDKSGCRMVKQDDIQKVLDGLSHVFTFGFDNLPEVINGVSEVVSKCC